MTAPPCPSAEALARDPNLCAICGHWCGKECERRWAPRTIKEICWHVALWARLAKSWGKPLDKDAFSAWLSTVPIARPVPPARCLFADLKSHKLVRSTIVEG